MLIGHGSWRANINRSEPEPCRRRPPCPKWLDRDAKRLWRKVVEFTHAMGSLSLLDGPVVAQYCQVWSLWKRAEEFLHRHGDTYPTRVPGGGPPIQIEWPQAKQVRRLAAELSRLERQLGISPQMRGKLPVNARPDTPYAKGFKIDRLQRSGGVANGRRQRQRHLARQRRLVPSDPNGPSTVSRPVKACKK